jgi:hypothetical protein
MSIAFNDSYLERLATSARESLVASHEPGGDKLLPYAGHLLESLDRGFYFPVPAYANNTINTRVVSTAKPMEL